MIRLIQPENRHVVEKMLTVMFSEIDIHNELFSENASSSLCDLYFNSNSGCTLGLLKYQNTKTNNESLIQNNSSPIAMLFGRLENRPLRKHQKALFIDAAFTLPAERRKGHMKSLVDYSCRWGEKQGAIILEMGTPVLNRKAIQFWRKIGFRPNFTVLGYPINHTLSDLH